MLIETEGGSNFTAAECRTWMRKAGFRGTYAAALAGRESMVSGTK